MSAEGVQHRQGQLTSQPQTVCPPPPWEALQGPPFPDQQGQETVHSLRVHPTSPPPPPTHRPLCTSPPPPGLRAPPPPPATEHLHFTSLLPPGLTATPSSSH